MPRGKRSERNFEQELELINEKLEKTKEKLEILQRKKELILAERREAEMKDIYNFMSEKGLAPSEVLEYLKNAKSE